jgi:hypothetical protein
MAGSGTESEEDTGGLRRPATRSGIEMIECQFEGEPKRLRGSRVVGRTGAFYQSWHGV